MRFAAWMFGAAMIGALAGHTLDEVAHCSGVFVFAMALLCIVFAVGAND
jgi:hypothetical protein